MFGDSIYNKLNVTYLNPSFCLPWFGEVELEEVVMFTIGGNSTRLKVHSNLRFVFCSEISNRGIVVYNEGPQRPFKATFKSLGKPSFKKL